MSEEISIDVAGLTLVIRRRNPPGTGSGHTAPLAQSSSASSFELVEGYSTPVGEAPWPQHNSLLASGPSAGGQRPDA